VQQHDQLANGLPDRHGQRLALARHSDNSLTQAHGDRQWFVRRHHVVAEHAVQRGGQRRAHRHQVLLSLSKGSSRASCPSPETHVS